MEPEHIVLEDLRQIETKTALLHCVDIEERYDEVEVRACARLT